MAEGYQIRLVKSGQELIDDVHNFDTLPDMVILDPDLPDANDLSLVHHIHQIVPELQHRGLFRTEYEGSTLRENLGLKRPVNQYVLAKANT